MASIGVIGGGPAGAAAALRLVRGGAEVTLFSPSKRGEKPCGGGLPDWLLPRIEGFAAAALPVVKVRSALIENGEGGTVEVATEGLRIFRRGDLDPAMVSAAQAAGARWVDAAVRAIEWDGQRPVVTAGGEQYALDWVIGACGARGVSRRSLGLEPVGDSLGLGASVTLDAETAASRTVPDRIVLSLPAVADAYCWVFPRPGGCSIGVAYSPDQLSHGAAAGLLADFAARFDRDTGAAQGATAPRPRYRYPIPVFGPWTLPAVRAAFEQRVLLVGDAAAVADPLTREGIRPAVLSGQWAADCLLAGEPERYPALLAAELSSEMARARRACTLFFDEPIGQLMVPVARWHPGIARVLGDLLSMRHGYRGLRRRLLKAAIGR
jgi:flavin-dependent dehydrogenase